MRKNKQIDHVKQTHLNLSCSNGSLFQVVRDSMSSTLYITGAGVSAESGIPTFRGEDGYWVIGSRNYTPQSMATRQMYFDCPDEFLLWYYLRFATYSDIEPNETHHWLAHKRLITQNIDGLDGKAGNATYIPIHGRLDKVTVLRDQHEMVTLQTAPWAEVRNEVPDSDDHTRLKTVLLEAFHISRKTKCPDMGKSLKPFVLLFDEYYTNMYRIDEATDWMGDARKFVFIGTSFSVNITQIALRKALLSGATIEVVDPEPVDLGIQGIRYHAITARAYVDKQD